MAAPMLVRALPRIVRRGFGTSSTSVFFLYERSSDNVAGNIADLEVSYQTLLFDVQDHVATVTLRRPERRNAWTKTLELELSAAMDRCDGDDDVRVVVITGSGQYFSVGAELDDPTLPANSDVASEEAPAMVLPGQLRKPVIAAINGDAIGAGSTYPLQCDIRIVSETARLGFVFVKRGLIPGYGSLWLLPRIIGVSKALELVITGRLISGVEAVELGVCHKAVPADQVLSHAQSVAAEIVAGAGPVSTALVKRLLLMSQELDLSQFREYETSAIQWCFEHSESTEGIASFLEKRAPRWSLSPKEDVPVWFDATPGE